MRKHSLDQEGNFIARPNAHQNVPKRENPKAQTTPTRVFRRRIDRQSEKNAEDYSTNKTETFNKGQLSQDKPSGSPQATLRGAIPN